MIKAEFFHVHRNHENVGDVVCCPQPYFPEFSGCEVKDISDLEVCGQSKVVIGGGGLMHPAFTGSLCMATQAKVKILWGVGSNVHDSDRLTYPVNPSNFSLAGIRDFGTAWDYVPCPSCLDPVFDQPIMDPIHEIVVYSHHQVPIGLLHEVPRLTNCGGSLKEAVSFLSSGQVVVTNSFHGAYWGMLLQRRVILYRPFSSRFLGFKFKPPVCSTRTSLFEALKVTRIHYDYKSECRLLNRQFAVKVMEALA
jgi:hypothetical protein